ncbi:hypothetical protein [Halanaerobium congolense]|jgi:hypothetical protein|uniref:DUF1819 family protein n=1 Tax=Halanaerobium congolense TaxID=54121 RepID=A0A1G6SIT0_9FIRM|nr:hypothetical protein [Halanaerobium congolense]PUU88310.1 MAG: hypothetical protein CI948_2348 [Halanaerobium sp.]PTX17333.1 hypothetical protein C7953_2115 [Halanaerobium congolense]TDS27115.1 hypothetical protein BY453_12917 [Halanaerobium congolense]TDX39617.1 hypothetical protein C7954_1309 [Halanaerobium congolense]SDD16561.1 hypothetical protein SAMN04488597_13010 [Halanaerobium congolense]
MKGFDRPLKPEWIYKTIDILEVGDTIYKKRDKIDNILVELDGKTGKRKVITVMGRYFLKDIDNSRGRKVTDNLIFNMVKEESFERAKPLMLFNLLVKAPILQKFSKEIYRNYSSKETIDANYLREKAYQNIGERDIARRSLRNFLNTLVDFSLIEVEGNNYTWKEKFQVDEELMVDFLKLYGKHYVDSPQISLLDLPKHIFFYFETPDLLKLAQKYNNVHWQYVRRINAALITMK